MSFDNIAVDFKNVCFRYPDADTEILEDINFTAEPGKTWFWKILI